MASEAERLAALEGVVESLRNKIAVMENTGGVWSGITGWLGNNPAFAHSLNALASMAIGAALSYFSGLTTVTKTVETPGPRETIIREVPAKDKAAEEKKLVGPPDIGAKPK